MPTRKELEVVPVNSEESEEEGIRETSNKEEEIEETSSEECIKENSSEDHKDELA